MQDVELERPQLVIETPGKLNLALAVGPRDGSGLHPICSWMVQVDLFDELTVTRLPADRFSRYAILWHKEALRRSDIDWPIQDDLAVRAHLALEAHTGERLPVQVKIEKRIPVGSGLGGGSSNAAHMLRAVDDLFDLGVGEDALASIGATLGADVPFFLDHRSAIVEGYGSSIERRASASEMHLVLIFPEAGCPTGRVYQTFDTLEAGPLRADAVRRVASMSPLRPDALFNDLTAAAMRIEPSLARIADRVSNLADRPAHVTGSGSTMFVLADDALHAEYLAPAIEQETSLPTTVVRTLCARRDPDHSKDTER